jgi:hypothetical protein
MGNSKIATLCYGLAVGFILFVVAFHSPTKVLVGAGVPITTTILNAK